MPPSTFVPTTGASRGGQIIFDVLVGISPVGGTAASVSVSLSVLFSVLGITGTPAGFVIIICSGSKSIGLKFGTVPSHRMTFPFSSSSTKLKDFLFARLNSTQPGRSIIGVPKERLTGGASGVE